VVSVHCSQLFLLMLYECAHLNPLKAKIELDYS
jgi:hypothetical protein